MPKSKEILDSEDDLSSSEEKPKTKKQKVEKTQTTAATESDVDEEVKKPVKNGKKVASKAAAKSDDESEEERKPAKKAMAKKNGETVNEKPADGMYEIGSMKFVNLNQFKGKIYVNIREYYEANGKLNPGKKGIALSIDQWQKLKSHIASIDRDIKNS